MNCDEKDIFLEIEKHLLEDEKPSIYLYKLLESGKLNEYPFSMIGDLSYVKQNPKYHPEGNVFIHTMMVIDEGARNRDKSKHKREFMWALLLHDIGKKPTTKMRKGKLTSYNHDIYGKEMARKFLEYFNESEEFIEAVTGLVRWHMQSLFVNKNHNLKNIGSMLEDVDKKEIVLVALSDRLGRGHMTSNERNTTVAEVKNFENEINKK